MRTVAFDTETDWMEEHGKATLCDVPPFVVMTWAMDDGSEPGIDNDPRACAERFLGWLRDDQLVIVAHNLTFDLRVMARLVWEQLGLDVTPLIMARYNHAGPTPLFGDTILRAQLLDVASGGLNFQGYQLATLVRQEFDTELEGKKDAHAWRYRYNELRDVPMAKWPKAAVDYALLDAVWALRLWKRLPPVNNELFQCAMDWALALTQAGGYLVDREWTENLVDWYEFVKEDAAAVLRKWGVMRDNGSKDTKAMKALFEDAWASIGEEPWKTEKGATSCAAAAFDYLVEKGATDSRLDLAEGEEGPFAAYKRYNRADKFMSTYLRPLLDAAEVGRPLVTSYNVFVATGRVSARGPNVTNFPARVSPQERGLPFTGKMIRGCFVPSPGCKLVTADYTAIEMGALAQICQAIGAPFADLTDAINKGHDLHIRVTAVALNMTYDECVAVYKAAKAKSYKDYTPLEASVVEWRQISKIANYSFPTGASWQTFMGMARLQGVDVTAAQAQRVREVWFETWRELPYYTQWVANSEGRDGFVIEQIGPNCQTKGWRRRVTGKFTEAANSPFQGLVADLAKFAGWQLCMGCFVDESSPLFGVARPWLFCHDEWIIEVKEDHAQPCADELSRVMISSAKKWMPDVRVEADADILPYRWEKTG